MHVTALAMLIATAPVWGQSPAANLTPEEIRDGWVLLFDGRTTLGWKTEGDAKVEDGRLVLGSSKSSATFDTPLPLRAELVFDVKGQIFSVLQSSQSRSRHKVDRSDEATWTTVRTLLTVTAVGSKLEMTYGRSKSTSESGPSTVARRPDPLRLSFESPGRGEIRQIKMRMRDAQSLFNGKDLTGWKVFPGKKSEFTVADGAIHIKNGPGDLQTDGSYKDFWLQFECKSNGKALNSGVFFRCRPNEYQNGYEAQVQNDFSKDPPREYDVEVYDPKTHQVVEKRKMRSAAADFGTGAIYRRIPARFGVARDGEWFTMTVAAQGNHFATWVNGMQQVDWYDNRPPSDNARTGFRREAGHLSLQGHDPTTDLSFRNFRIIEQPVDD